MSETTYRVTWQMIDDGPDGPIHEETFRDIDQGWTFYQQTKKSRFKMKANWEHVRGVATDE